MARDPSVLDDGRCADSTPVGDEIGGNRGLIGRRSFLKVAGATTATAAVLSGTGLASEDFEVIEADNRNYHLDDGEVFENKIIDFSNGNWFTVIASATNWEIRNVGFRGVHDHDHNAIVVADTAGGDSVVEDIYLGDGCIRPAVYSSHGQCGIFVHRNHSGHIDFRNVYAEDWPNNGIYGSAAAYDDPGTIRIENCFAKNNYVANFRCSDGSTVIDSVAYNDGNGRYTGRPFWGWGDQAVINCRLHAGPYSNGSAIWGRDGSRTYVEDTLHTGYGMSGSGRYEEGSGVRITRDMDLSVPDGIPQSAEAAARGLNETDEGEDEDESEAGGGTDEDADAVSGDGDAEGNQGENEDEDGSDGGATCDDPLPHAILIDGTAGSGPSGYTIRVTGSIAEASARCTTYDSDAVNEDGAVRGVVNGWFDAYWFDGLIRDATVVGDAEVHVEYNARV